MTTYKQHGEFLGNVMGGASAEMQGFLDAKIYDSPLNYYVPRFQWRYEQGFNYGKHLLKKELVNV